MSLDENGFLILPQSNLSIFPLQLSLMVVIFVLSKKCFPTSKSRIYSPMLPSKKFSNFAFTVRSIIFPEVESTQNTVLPKFCSLWDFSRSIGCSTAGAPVLFSLEHRLNPHFNLPSPFNGILLHTNLNITKNLPYVRGEIT